MLGLVTRSGGVPTRNKRTGDLQFSGALEDHRLYSGLPQRDGRRKPADTRPDHYRLHSSATVVALDKELEDESRAT